MGMYKARTSGVCRVCSRRVKLTRYNKKLWKHGSNGAMCPGATTSDYTDEEPIPHVVELYKAHPVTEQQITEHSEMRRLFPPPGGRRSWQERWYMKTGVWPKL